MLSMILHSTPPRRWLRALCENGGLHVSGQVLHGPHRPERAGAGKPQIPGGPAQRRLFHGGPAHGNGRLPGPAVTPPPPAVGASCDVPYKPPAPAGGPVTACPGPPGSTLRHTVIGFGDRIEQSGKAYRQTVLRVACCVFRDRRIKTSITNLCVSLRLCASALNHPVWL